MRKSTITEIISVLLMILFLYAGVSKLTEYGVFKEQIAASPVLKPMAGLVAWVLPAIEFVVTFLLLIPRWRLKGLYASLALMILFTGYIIAILAFSKELPCSCGGVLALLSWPAHLVLNIVFIVLASIGIRLERQVQRAINTRWAEVGQTDLKKYSY